MCPSSQNCMVVSVVAGAITEWVDVLVGFGLRETGMSIEICVLASGSAGNCTVVRTPAGVMLIDAGFGPRTTAQRLAGTGVHVSDISGICLTHLDHDHFNRNWLGTILDREVRVFCHLNQVDDLF